MTNHNEGARRSVQREEQTDARVLQLFRRLTPAEQREWFAALDQKVGHRVVAFNPLLNDPRILAECRRLGRGCGIEPAEIAHVIDPFQYTSYFARSPRCTMAKLTAVDYGRWADAAEVIVFVKAYKEVEFEHPMIPESFDLHVMNGHIDVRRGARDIRAQSGSVFTITAGGHALIRACGGCWFMYSGHPLTSLVRIHAA